MECNQLCQQDCIEGLSQVQPESVDLAFADPPLAIGDEYAAELKLIFQKELGFTCRSWVIWYYTFGVNCTKKFSRSHTHLFHFVRDSKKFTFNNLRIRVPSARQLVYADARADSQGRLPD